MAEGSTAKLRAKMEKLKSKLIDTSTVIEMYNQSKAKAQQQEETIRMLKETKAESEAQANAKAEELAVRLEEAVSSSQEVRTSRDELQVCVVDDTALSALSPCSRCRRLIRA